MMPQFTARGADSGSSPNIVYILADDLDYIALRKGLIRQKTA